MDKQTGQPILSVTGVRKKYRLGQFGADTFQEEFKQWISRRGHAESEDPLSSGSKTIYALNGVDLTVYPGERVGIIGKNGAGKSTLLKLLCRITAPTEGKIRLWGRVASMLEVGTGFHGDMTGRENIFLNAAIHGMSRTDIENKIEDIIDFSEIREFIDTPVKRYSSGMFVKLGFAVAAHIDCEIMIMDEVLAVGDMEFQHKCLDKMRDASVNDGRTILYVSHNMNTIQRLCSRCIVMDKGKITFDGNVQEAISIYLGANNSSSERTVFSSSYRPYDSILRMNQRLNIDWIEVPEGVNVFKSGETAEFSLHCTAVKPLKRVGFRFELWGQTGMKIGTMLSGSFADLDAGENDLTLVMDFSHLAFGQYKADLVAYLFDSEGNEDILDGVYPAIQFTITTPLDEVNYLDWHHDYWGNIRLHDVIVKKQEKKHE